MRKVELNMKEELKYKVIKDLVDRGPDGNKKRAAVKLGCTIRTINRLITVYVTEGKQGFSHKNKGKAPPTRIGIILGESSPLKLKLKRMKVLFPKASFTK